MKIALLGTRGIPARYGGFETFAEELSVRLAQRGHQVTVYGRTNNVRTREPLYRGVRLALLPTIAHKYFDTVAHTFLSTLHLLFHRADVALYCNSANAIFTALPRAAGMPTVLNVDGLEFQRKKWNSLGRAWYRWSERLSTWLPSAVVSDAVVIQRHYAERYGKQTSCIVYGAETGKVETRAALDRLGLQPEEYFLYVSRMEPENNARLVVKAFERVPGAKKLVMVGDAPYAGAYIRELKNTRDPRILFPGGIYGDGYKELQSHCFAYIHATEVGGTHPALIESMGRGCAVLFLETPENAEVAGGVGMAYPKSEEALAAAIAQVAALSPEQLGRMGEAGVERVRERYSWDAVVERYEELFRQVSGKAR